MRATAITRRAYLQVSGLRFRKCNQVPNRFSGYRRKNEEPLRRIAENSTQLRWMLPYIDFVIRSNRPH